MLIYRKIKLEEVFKVYSLYCSERSIRIDLTLGKRAKAIYEAMLNSGSFIYGAFDDDRLVGVVNVTNVLNVVPQKLKSIHLFLEEALVLEEYQNQKIMTNIIENIIAKLLKDYSKIYLSTNCNILKKIILKLNEENYQKELELKKY